MPNQFGFMSIISIPVPDCDLQSDVFLITQRNHRHTILPERSIWKFSTSKETYLHANLKIQTIIQKSIRAYKDFCWVFNSNI